MEKTIEIILGIAIAITLSAMTLWGMGALIVWVFKINYTWTFWHGLASVFIIGILKSIFGGNKGE